MKDKVERLISARVLGSNFVLKGSPKPLKCAGALSRVSAKEGNQFQLTVLGNPTTGDFIEIEVRGTKNQSLRLELSDGQGRPLIVLEIEQAKAIEYQRLKDQNSGKQPSKKPNVETTQDSLRYVGTVL